MGKIYKGFENGDQFFYAREPINPQGEGWEGEKVILRLKDVNGDKLENFSRLIGTRLGICNHKEIVSVANEEVCMPPKLAIEILHKLRCDSDEKFKHELEEQLTSTPSILYCNVEHAEMLKVCYNISHL